MTLEDKELLDTHVKAMPAAGYAYAKILYKNMPWEKIETFEGIETAVRDQVLEHVSPKIAFFLSEKRLEQRRVKHGHFRIINSWAARNE